MYKRIEELCTQKGITGYRMCKDLGYSPSTMTELRKGRVKALSPDKVSAIANYFNVSTDYILNGEKEKAPTLSGEDSEFDSIFSQLSEQNKKIALAQLKALLDNQ